MNRTDGVFIIWPEQRFVPWRIIDVWYNDAVCNGDIDLLEIVDEPRERAHQLSDAGLITLRGN
jgi:hypothetical protein